MKIVITGGHHSSALPVIKKLREKYPRVKILWFGHKYSALGDKNPTLEYREITALDIPFRHIQAGKFYRTLNLIRLIKIPFGFFQCLYLLVRDRPDIILSFGGYLSVPAVLAGYILGIPSVTHEQTVVAGWANRLVSVFAKRVLISWKESAKYFPEYKTVFVGLPLRKEIWEIRSDSFVVDNALPYVYVTTGKIGSHVINTAIEEALDRLLSFTNVIHQCGDNSVYNDFNAISKKYAGLGAKPGKLFLKKFIFENEIGEAYSRASLVVSRCGAHTTGELLALRKKCLLIPIPWVSHNEQNENAKLLVREGLGKVLKESELTSDSLVNGIRQALESLGSAAAFVTQSSSAKEEPEDLIIDQLVQLKTFND